MDFTEQPKPARDHITEHPAQPPALPVHPPTAHGTAKNGFRELRPLAGRRRGVDPCDGVDRRLAVGVGDAARDRAGRAVITSPGGAV